MPSNQLACLFESLPESGIACDREGRILQANAAALQLFEVPSEELCGGRDYQQFLHRYAMRDEQQRAITLEPWLTSLVTDEEALSVLQIPSGRKVYVTIRCFPLLNARKQAVGTVYVFHDSTHRYQKALHLQRVHHALSTLKEAIAHLPEHLDFASPDGPFLLSPPVLFVAQQLVDVIGQVLDCHHAWLLAFGPAGRLHYAVGSGFTPEQEQYQREMRGRFLPSDFVDETVVARLAAGQEVLLPTARLHHPPRLPRRFWRQQSPIASPGDQRQYSSSSAPFSDVEAPANRAARGSERAT